MYKILSMLLKEKINELLWDKDFYKAIHSENFENPSISVLQEKKLYILKFLLFFIFRELKR